MKTRLFTTLVVLFFAVTYAAAQLPKIENYRSLGLDGVNVFEAPKTEAESFDGIKIRLGGAFSQSYQLLDHTSWYTKYFEENPNDQVNTPDDLLLLVPMKYGFNLAQANFNIDAQLADGIRLELVTYLSARHHNEAWVKGGYIQFDKLPFLNSEAFDNLMKNVTIKIGHMEVNYGDQHFRRRDGGNSSWNPFVGNYIMDAFNTEIGGEIYYRNSGFIGMVGISEGEIKGDNKGTNEGMSPAVYFKLGYDKQINPDLRLRLTGSYYGTNDEVATNHIFDGDRTGSSYFYALEGVKSAGRGGIASTSATSQYKSGRYAPGFSNKVSTIVINPFVKFQGFELFGTYEMASGGKYGATADGKKELEAGDDPNLVREFKARQVNQFAVEGVYRFFNNESLFVAARYNRVSGELFTGVYDNNLPAGYNKDPFIQRTSFAAGWYLTKNILAKVEYVNQGYFNFPDGDKYGKPAFTNDDYGMFGDANNGLGAKFNGLMIEAVIGF